MDKTVDMSAAEAALRMSARGGAVVDPTDELCPPWWPARRPAARRRRGAESDDIRAADRVYVALTLLAATLPLDDEPLSREVRAVAVTHLLDGAEVLARGASGAWEPGVDVCPPWSWGTGGGFAQGTLPPIVHPGAPADAGHLLDVLVLLQLFCLAARLPMDSARDKATRAIGQALLEEAFVAARTFT